MLRKSDDDFTPKVDKLIRDINRLTNTPKVTKDELIRQLELIVSDIKYQNAQAELKGINGVFENLTKLNYKLTEKELV